MTIALDDYPQDAIMKRAPNRCKITPPTQRVKFDGACQQEQAHLTTIIDEI